MAKRTPYRYPIAAEVFVACCLLSPCGLPRLLADDSLQAGISPKLLQEVFAAQHEGWSLDEVMLSDTRRGKIVAALQATVPEWEEKAIWESLVRLRKSGKLRAETTQREKTEYGDALAAAEIAARRMQDEFEVTFDQVLIDPTLLRKYDLYARDIDDRSEAYTLRKAALHLRKSRQLQPELVLRVTDWKKEMVAMSVEDAKQRKERLPERPGVYLFRDASGYVYIGQSNNLRERLTKHFEDSDRRGLAEYLKNRATGTLILELHVFREGSPAEQTVVREAYESELIRSRKPQLNLSP